MKNCNERYVVGRNTWEMTGNNNSQNQYFSGNHWLARKEFIISNRGYWNIFQECCYQPNTAPSDNHQHHTNHNTKKVDNQWGDQLHPVVESHNILQ